MSDISVKLDDLLTMDKYTSGLETGLATLKRQNAEMAAAIKQLNWYLKKAAGICMTQGEELSVYDDDKRYLYNQWELGRRCNMALVALGNPSAVLSAYVAERCKVLKDALLDLELCGLSKDPIYARGYLIERLMRVRKIARDALDKFEKEQHAD